MNIYLLRELTATSPERGADGCFEWWWRFADGRYQTGVW